MKPGRYKISMTAVCRDHMALRPEETLLIVADTTRRELAEAMAGGRGRGGIFLHPGRGR